ncbi:MAG: RNA polymerase sigma factor [Planctomycetaceae bacterium]|nr:RNA polymerase sigma factor [Planctomycetaceae bacterium]
MAITRNSLILRITQGGDPLSWEEFFELYQPMLFGMVKHWRIEDADASDIVQDVFVTLIRSLPQFEYQTEKGRFRSWLRTIVRNVTIDWFRRRGRSREVTLNECLCPEDPVADELEWDAAYCAQVLHTVMRIVQEESHPTTWFCFDEHILQGRRAAEVGDECGLATGAVYVNSSRTLARIRRKCASFDADLAFDPESVSVMNLRREGDVVREGVDQTT